MCTRLEGSKYVQTMLTTIEKWAEHFTRLYESKKDRTKVDVNENATGVDEDPDNYITE